MALKEEAIQNCADVEGIKEALITNVNRECKSSLNKPSGSLSYSSLTSGNFTVKKEPQRYTFFTGDQSVNNIEDSKETAAKRSIEECQHPPHQLEGIVAPNYTAVIKEECSLSEESRGSSQFDGLTPDISLTSSNLSPVATKHNDAMRFKSEGEEVHLSSSSNKNYASPPAPSKQKLRNTKRRAGILYKQITSSKLSKVTSKYFSQAHNNNKKLWIPPRSPYSLVQEDLFDNPWQLLVATIFLTKTTAKKALPQLHKFLARYPRPQDVLNANYEDIDEYFKPLGLTTTRSHIIMRFTVEFLEKDWTYPRELYGIGKYGDDSYRMFCINEWRQVSPDDIPLSMYRNWLMENAERLGVE